MNTVSRLSAVARISRAGPIAIGVSVPWISVGSVIGCDSARRGLSGAASLTSTSVETGCVGALCGGENWSRVGK